MECQYDVVMLQVLPFSGQDYMPLDHRFNWFIVTNSNFACCNVQLYSWLQAIALQEFHNQPQLL